MQGQQQIQQQAQKPGLWQRLQLGRQVAGIFAKAMRQDAAARQIEDVLVAGLEQVGVAAETVQTFRDRLEKTRQASIFAYIEDTYVMGGILLYCGILVPTFIGVGIPDLFSHVAWVAFAFSFPGAIGFFLARFIKERNSISTWGSRSKWTGINVRDTLLSICMFSLGSMGCFGSLETQREKGGSHTLYG